MDLLPYQVYNAAGTLVLQAPKFCRSSKRVEQDQLKNGYTIILNGRPIAKAAQGKEVSGK